MSFDFDEMLQTIKDKQWSLADIDWEAPGAETMSEGQRARLKPFMADLVWIENVGARAFAALAESAPAETIAQIYRYFHAEEQKHANAELALMKRWGMLSGGETPEPNVQVRMAIRLLDQHAGDMPPAGLATVIAMLEVCLDGALVKFLLDEVSDPLCHEVFRHINSDESRHLTVDFAVLDLVGASRASKLAIDAAGVFKPTVMLGLLVVFVPLLNKMRDNIVAMGLSEQKLYNAVKRFAKLGDRSANTQRLLSYHLFKRQLAMVTDRSHPYHRFLADPMVRLTDRVPARLLGGQPSWSTELTHEPIDR